MELYREDYRSPMKIQYNCVAVVVVVVGELDVVVELMWQYLLLNSAAEVDDQAHYFASRQVKHLQMQKRTTAMEIIIN